MDMILNMRSRNTSAWYVPTARCIFDVDTAKVRWEARPITIVCLFFLMLLYHSLLVSELPLIVQYLHVGCSSSFSSLEGLHFDLKLAGKWIPSEAIAARSGYFEKLACCATQDVPYLVYKRGEQIGHQVRKKVQYHFEHTRAASLMPGS